MDCSHQTSFHHSRRLRETAQHHAKVLVWVLAILLATVLVGCEGEYDCQQYKIELDPETGELYFYGANCNFEGEFPLPEEMLL